MSTSKTLRRDNGLVVWSHRNNPLFFTESAVSQTRHIREITTVKETMHHCNVVMIPLAETIKHKDAFRAFAKLLDAAAAVNDFVVMAVKPSDAGLVERLGVNLNPVWHAVYVEIDQNTVFSITVDYCYDAIVYPFAREMKSSRLWTNNSAFVELLNYSFDRTMDPMVCIACRDDLAIENKTIGTIDDWCRITDRKFAVHHFEGSYSSAKRQLELIDEPTAYIMPPDRMYVRISASRLVKPHVYWMHGAVCRWPFNHQLLIECSLTLYSLIPPYVLLWIFDCLPFSTLFLEPKKIHHIERVYASIRKVLRFRREPIVTRSRNKRVFI